jgi:hypothetical protein
MLGQYDTIGVRSTRIAFHYLTLELSGGGKSINPQQLDWQEDADIRKKRILFWFVRGMWLSAIGGQEFSLVNYASLRKKAGQGINIECDTMQAAKIHRSKR